LTFLSHGFSGGRASPGVKTTTKTIGRCFQEFGFPTFLIRSQEPSKISLFVAKPGEAGQGDELGRLED
jgi:hypothetical protein